MSRIEVDEVLLIFATRYALGRRTYAVGMVIREIEDNIENLSYNTINVIIESIDTQPDLGDKCDVDDWLNLRSLLESRRREKKMIF